MTRFAVRPIFTAGLDAAVFNLVDEHPHDGDGVLDQGMNRRRLDTLASVLEAAHDVSVGARLALGEEEPRSIPAERLGDVLRESVARVIGAGDADAAQLLYIRTEGAKALEEATEALQAATSRAAIEASRADVAEQMVCEARALFARVYDEGASYAVDAFLYSTEPVVGRWRKVDRDARDPWVHEDDVAAIKAERDAAVAEAWRLNAVEMERDAAIRARDEVGIQLAAAQAVIARMQPVVDAARGLLATLDRIRPYAIGETLNDEAHIRRALRALDTVPGDALAPPSPAGASAPASGSTPAASSVTSSGSEVVGSRCGPSGTDDTEDPAAGLLAASGIVGKGVE